VTGAVGISQIVEKLFDTRAKLKQK
jgi:hypothetical protein